MQPLIQTHVRPQRRGGVSGGDHGRGQSLQIDAGAIVLDTDAHARAELARLDRHPAARRLAERVACLGRLDAVIERVAQQMQQGVAQLLEDRAVDAILGAVDAHCDALAELEREIAREAWIIVEDVAEWHQARLGDLVGERVGEMTQPAFHAVVGLGQEIERRGPGGQTLAALTQGLLDGLAVGLLAQQGRD